MTKKPLNSRELYKATLDYILKECGGASLLDLDEEACISAINPDLDEISMMNQAELLIQRVMEARRNSPFFKEDETTN